MNINGGDVALFRNKCDGAVNNSISMSSGSYNGSSISTEASTLKTSSHIDPAGQSTQNVKDSLGNKRLLSTSSTDQAFGSSKSLSNTEVTSQTSVLSSASCSSSSSLLSSNCGMIPGKEACMNHRPTSQNKLQNLQPTISASQNLSEKDSVQKSPEIKELTDPPPIPPKISSNQSSSGLLSLSPPALPTTLPPVASNELCNIANTNVDLNHVNESIPKEGEKCVNPPMIVEIEDENQRCDNDSRNKSHEESSDKETIFINEHIIDTTDIVNAVIYIDDEDDLGATASLNEKSK